ncbi:MAG: HesA/MoeB/ThiF family protein [Parvularculaceae bacterium]
MLDADSRERYLRHILLKEVGAQGQHKLRAARVLIVGAGGLGGPILQYLAAAGVGALGVIDDDSVALSNLQRQTIFTTKDIGEAKVARAAAFANALNPGVRVIAQKEKLTAENAADHLAEFDIIVEGVDNFDARFALNTACIKARKPLVSAAIGRFEGHLSVFKPWAGAGLPWYRCLVPARRRAMSRSTARRRVSDRSPASSAQWRRSKTPQGDFIDRRYAGRAPVRL